MSGRTARRALGRTTVHRGRSAIRLWGWLTCLVLLAACSPRPLPAAALDAGRDAGLAPDADAADAGAKVEVGPPDAGSDAGADAGLAPDAGAADAGSEVHAGVPDAGSDAGSCPVLTAAPDVDPWAVRLPSAGFGGTVVQTSGGHTDVFLKSPGPQADYTRVGVRLDWGGTIVFWGLSANAASNTIDANDTGREVQIALCDPQRNRQSCAFDASCLTSTASCGNSITYLGWDPVQGGDECDRGATATWSVVGDALRVEVTPVQWNPDWDAPDCRTSVCSGAARPAQVRYAMELRFVNDLVVELTLEVQSQETLDHALTAQEFPTLYVSHGGGGPDLPVLLDAAGQTIAIDQPANDGFTMKNFASAAPWVSFQNAARDYGVGLGMDQGVSAFQGWAGDGATAPYFHNVRARLAFGLAHGATVRGRAYLALGSFDTIASTLASVFAHRPPFGWVDAPAAGSVARGASVPVAGWVLAPVPVSSVEVEVDGRLAATLPVSAARPDVCAVYPAYAGCPAVGFSGAVSTAGLDGCPHLLRVVAIGPDGARSVLGERLIRP